MAEPYLSELRQKLEEFHQCDNENDLVLETTRFYANIFSVELRLMLTAKFSCRCHRRDWH